MKYTVYGYRDMPHRLTASGSRGRAPLHFANLDSEADATLHLMIAAMQHGVTPIHAVVVRLDHGVDKNGERHVIRRVGDGRAWWE